LVVSLAAWGVGCGRNGADPGDAGYDAAAGGPLGHADASVSDGARPTIDAGGLDAGSDGGGDLGDATIDAQPVDAIGGGTDDATAVGDTGADGQALDAAPLCDAGAQQCMGSVIVTCVGGAWTLTQLCPQMCSGNPPMCTSPDACTPALWNDQ
jgi:hypothetical protein